MLCGVSGSFLILEIFNLYFSFLHPALWSVGVTSGAPAAILHLEDEGHPPWMTEQKA